MSRTRGSVWVWLTRCTGAVTSSNVSLTDSVSGVLGLGFPRLSVIQQSVNGQFCPVIERLCCMLSLAAAAPFFANLAQRGLVEYPLFGLSLTRNSSGSLTLGASAIPLVGCVGFSCALATGAVDGSVVTNISLIHWNPVVPFAPSLGSASNTSSYLQWTVPLGNISVSAAAGVMGFTLTLL